MDSDDEGDSADDADAMSDGADEAAAAMAVTRSAARKGTQQPQAEVRSPPCSEFYLHRLP